jgi:Amt family ammonium transporter
MFTAGTMIANINHFWSTVVSRDMQMRKLVGWGLLFCGLAWTSYGAEATPALMPLEPASSGLNSGDIAWMLMASALVMLMTPGLAFFYGGLVRKKNILSVVMQCFMVLCIVSIQWIFCGYSLSFGPDVGGLIGSLDWVGFANVGMNPGPYAAHIPHRLFAIYQMMFAIITPALICGAFAERMRFSAFCIFSILWSTLVYAPVAHWVWGGGGFLGLSPGCLGAVDFAGGIVVHINAGMAALAAVLVMKRRRGFPHQISPPHNLPIAVLGAALLWFGWYGFNAGSALAANTLAVTAFLNTHAAGAVAGLVWCLLDWLKFGRPTTLGMITGAVAGLAAVTPAAGFVEISGAIWIGIGSGIVCWLSVTALKAKFNYDDSLDAFGVHGVGGLWGSLAVGLWATQSVNSTGVNGLFYGHATQFVIQAKASVLVAAFSFVASWLLFKLVDHIIGLRVTGDEENLGLDLSQHRESGYTVID